MAKRILIADDSVTIQKAFAMTLAGEDLALVAARSVEEGLSMAQRGRPDLVIADGVMSDGSGYDLCLAIKSDPGLRGVPVHILTSSHNPFDEARARQVGADGHFVKPFDSLALVAGLSAALAKGTVAGPPVQAAAPRVAPSVVLMDDYGEISVGGSDGGRDESVAPAPAPVVAPVPAPGFSPARPTAQVPAVGMRPSLIPGMRPGAPAARPGTAAPAAPLAPVRSPGMPGVGASAPVSPVVPRGPAPQAPASAMRTMIGVPATGLQPPPRAPAPGGMVPQARPSVSMPVVDGRAPMPTSGSIGSQVAASVASRVAERMTAISARGPEYEAIAKLSKEIIEKIAWEIVPELAEAIIREELQKRGRV